MSWDSYIKNLEDSKKVSKAAICGHDGNVWVKSNNFAIRPGEVTAIFLGYSNPSNIQASGFKLEDEEFFTVKADSRSIYGKKGSAGVACVKTNQAIIIGEYEAPTQPGECTTVVENLGDYLESVGY